MEFGVINAMNGAILLGILIPNLLYAVRGGGDAKPGNRFLLIAEQLGRYASMALMVLPLGVWEFGFPNVAALLIYLAGNGALLAAYWIGWVLFFKRKTYPLALLLAAVPVGIFLLTAVCLHHWLLAGAAIVFAIGHLSIAARSKKSPGS